MADLLVVDDEASIRRVLRQLFEYEGHRVREAGTGMEALKQVEQDVPDLVFLDVRMPGMDGMEVLRRLLAAHPGLQVIMMSGHGTIQTALAATRAGALDFLEKPLDTDRLLLTLRNALERKGLADSVRDLRSRIDSEHAMVGRAPAFLALVEQIERVAPTDARVLITGENGTGKELVARALHRGSRRSDRPFIEVNCAAIPSELIESELFGHIKGSFTGAIQDRDGTFQQAHQGTLFLDEIGDMALPAQAKVLRALEEGKVSPVGGGAPRPVDVRVLAATNKNLEEEIAAGRFREDLFYRLNVVPLSVPSLRTRREDIPELVEHFRQRMIRKEGLRPLRFSEEAMRRLVRAEWPGNVRQLRNTVERLLILAPGPEITAADIERLVSGAAQADSAFAFLEAPTYQAFRDESERVFLSLRLDAHGWNVSETARALDMPRSNLYKKMERLNLERPPEVDAS
jgi:two-component system, NtrC family, nitrogen regulation response regulator NtrX